MKDPRAPIRFLKKTGSALSSSSLTDFTNSIGTTNCCNTFRLPAFNTTNENTSTQSTPLERREKKIENFSTVQKMMNNMNFAVQL